MDPRTDLLDWDGGHGLRFTHDLFKFPGKFHPPLVEQILKSFTPTGVVDPMAGVGTVSVEAKAMGISWMKCPSFLSRQKRWAFHPCQSILTLLAFFFQR